MDELPLAGKVIALVGTGSEEDRLTAISCAEAGADLALGTETHSREQDYAIHSIANEIWAIGREHVVRPLQGPAEVAELIAEAHRKFGRCDALVARKKYRVEGIPAIDPGASLEAVIQAIRDRR